MMVPVFDNLLPVTNLQENYQLYNFSLLFLFIAFLAIFVFRSVRQHIILQVYKYPGPYKDGTDRQGIKL
jgi:hypothetical protein